MDARRTGLIVLLSLLAAVVGAAGGAWMARRGEDAAPATTVEVASARESDPQRARPHEADEPRPAMDDYESGAGRMAPLAPSDAPAASHKPLSESRRPSGRPTLRPDGTLRVVALVEGSFAMSHPEWAALVRERIAAAGALLDQAAGIRVELAADPIEWQPSSAWTGIEELLETIDADCRPWLAEHDADLAIGFAAQLGPLSSGDRCGLARVLRDTCVVLDLSTTAMTEDLCRVTVAHEIAHCFGCFHVDDPESIMVRQAGDRIPTRFDDANRRVLELTRGLDLSVGQEALPESVVVRIAELAQDYGHPGEANTGAGALEWRAYKAEDLKERIRLCRLALKYDPLLGRTRVNLADALARTDHTDAARRELRRALADQPELWEAEPVRLLWGALCPDEEPPAPSGADEDAR